MPLLADRQGINEGGVLCALHGLEQGRQEGRQLTPALAGLVDLAQIHGQLVQKYERGPTAEESSQRIGTWRNMAFVTLTDTLVSVFSCEEICDFSPRGSGKDATTHCAAVRGIGVLPIERSYPDDPLRN